MSYDWKAHFGGDGFGSDYDVATIQARLNALGADPQLAVDGSMGPMTNAAIVAFQQSHGIEPDGVVGPITGAALGITPSLQSSPGSSGSPVSIDTPAGTVPAHHTSLTPDQAAKALSDGYKLVTGSKPNQNVLALLVGQSAFETGNWKSIFNYNFGNKKATSGDRSWYYIRCSEIVDGQEVFYDPPSPVCRFTAYGSAAEGAAAHIKMLQGRPHWWDGLHTETVAGYIQGLTTRPAYFTASPALYAKGMTDRMNTYMAYAAQYAGTAAAGIGGILLMVGAGALWFFRKKLFG